MTLHTKLSYAKSIVRIFGCIFATIPAIMSETRLESVIRTLAVFAGAMLVAELIGIAEELPGAYKGTHT